MAHVIVASNTIVLKWVSTKTLSFDQVEALASNLSPQEKVRAAKFRRDEDRRIYIAAHALLRVMLAKTLKRSVADLRFGTEAQGKPVLLDSNLEFNLSHTADLAVVGLCRGRKIGVDAEWLGRNVSLEIAPMVLTSSECACLNAQSLERRERTFLKYWTLKEALMKATGQGLTLAPNSFEVAIAPPLVVTRPLADLWQIHDIPAPTGYVAALAIEGPEDVTFDVSEASVQWIDVNPA